MTLDEIKEKVSILEFIKFRNDLGFIIKRDGKNAKAFVPSRDENGQIQYENKHSIKKENLIVSRLTKPNGAQYEVYFETNNFDKGKSKSIIDFVSEFVLKESRIDFKKVTGVLYQYMNDKNFVSIDNSSFDLISNNKPKSDLNNNAISKKINFELPTKTTLQYLKGRGLDSKILMSSKFIGTYGSYNDSESNIIDKPAFILTKNNKKKQTLQWIDYKNGKHTGKYFVKDVNRDSSLFRSNYEKNNNTIVLIECPEKAMAHFQQFEKELKNQNVDPIYLSSCGQITKNDLDSIREFSNEKNINNYVLAFDNDIPGQTYTLNTILYLNGIEGSVKYYPDQKKFGFNSNPENENKFCSFLQNQRIGFGFSNGKIVVNLSFELFIKCLDKFKFNSKNNIIVHNSITKDFLDDLNEGKKLPFNFNKTENKNLTL